MDATLNVNSTPHGCSSLAVYLPTAACSLAVYLPTAACSSLAMLTPHGCSSLAVYLPTAKFFCTTQVNRNGSVVTILSDVIIVSKASGNTAADANPQHGLLYLNAAAANLNIRMTNIGRRGKWWFRDCKNVERLFQGNIKL